MVALLRAELTVFCYRILRISAEVKNWGEFFWKEYVCSEATWRESLYPNPLLSACFCTSVQTNNTTYLLVSASLHLSKLGPELSITSVKKTMTSVDLVFKLINDQLI